MLGGEIGPLKAQFLAMKNTSEEVDKRNEEREAKAEKRHKELKAEHGKVKREMDGQSRMTINIGSKIETLETGTAALAKATKTAEVNRLWQYDEQKRMHDEGMKAMAAQMQEVERAVAALKKDNNNKDKALAAGQKLEPFHLKSQP